MIDLFDSFMYRQLWDEARAVIRKGLVMDPENGGFIGQLYFLNYLQFGDKATYLEHLNRASTPESTIGRFRRARSIRDYDLALRLIGQIETSEFILGLYFDDLFEPINLNAALIWFLLENREKMVEEATFSKAFIKGILSRDPKSKGRYRNDLAICHAMLGELQEAQALMDEERQFLARNNHALARFEIDQAIMYLLSGDKDAAIASLARAVEARPDLPFKREMDIYYLWDPLRGDPRFDALLAE
jgi:tetratricopeptide (TPR) repeat protein